MWRSCMFGIRSGIAGGRSGGPDVGSGGSSAVLVEIYVNSCWPV